MRSLLVSLMLGTAVLAGCVVDASPAPRPIVVTTGSAIFRWSVAGTFDPFQCDALAAHTLRITVFDDFSGAFIGEWIAPCRDFSTRVDLSPGTYRASVALEGAGGQRTTSIAVNPFTIIAGTDIILELDFPFDSFV